MKKLLTATFFIALSFHLFAQEKVKLYDPEIDALQQIDKAVNLASSSGKHVFIQVGGNWCSWCVLFHNYVQDNEDVKKLLEDNYVIIKLNYSQENRNEAALERLGFPNRFGFPVFVILNGEGKRLHTQDTGLLEEGRGYNKGKVTRFLKSWTSDAVSPETYTQ